MPNYIETDIGKDIEDDSVPAFALVEKKPKDQEDKKTEVFGKDVKDIKNIASAHKEDKEPIK